MKENYLYYLGLDLGSNSVGWAVTDEEYNIVRRKGKALWGIRLFEQADTAAERSMRKTKVKMLGEIFYFLMTVALRIKIIICSILRFFILEKT